MSPPRSNSALTSMDGFPSLASIGGQFSVNNNDALASIKDFQSLATVGSSFNIYGNYVLQFTVKECKWLSSKVVQRLLSAVANEFEAFVTHKYASTTSGSIVALLGGCPSRAPRTCNHMGGRS